MKFISFIKFIIFIFLVIFAGVILAGSLTPSTDTDTPTMYTVNDFYNLIVNNSTTTSNTHTLSTTTTPIATSSHSISEIYARLANLIKKDKLKTGTTYLGVTGDYGVTDEREDVPIIYSLLSTTSDPTSSGYTLEDIYNLITNNATTTAGSHSVSTTTSPASSMYSLSSLYTSLSSLIIANTVATGTTYLGVVGTLDVPGAPTIGTATAGDAQATVTFTAPLLDGGETIDYYTASSSPDGINVSTTSTSTVVVTGLTNDTPYTFTVYAHSAIGTSTASASSNEVTPTAEVDLGLGLVAHYKMNDNAGTTTVIDSIGSDSGTAQRNTDVLTTSKINSALSFNGTSDYVTVPNEQNFDFDIDDNFSISFWSQRLTDGGANYDDTVMNKAGGGAGWLISLRRNTDWCYWFWLGDGLGNWTMYSVPNNIRPLDDGGWHFFTILWNGSNTGTDRLSLYADGISYPIIIGEGDGGDVTTMLNDAPIRIGARYDGGRYPGNVDDVRIYNRLLTSGEIVSLYNSGSGTESETGSLGTDLVVHYKMNDNTATKDVVDSKGTNTGIAVRNTNLMTSAKIGSALSFNGTSDYISALATDLNGTSGTISIWAKLDEGYDSGPYFVWRMYGPADLPGLYYDAGGTQVIGQRFGGAHSLSGTLNEWHHYVEIWDETSTSFYVDGQYDSGSESPPNNVNNPIVQSIVIGNGDDGDNKFWFPGSIDDVRIYSRALNTGEVSALYNSGAGTEEE